MSNYEQKGKEIGQLVTAKQIAYGRSFDRCGEVLRILYPDGISLEQYDDALAVTRILDKLFRVASGSLGGETPYKDIAGYGLLGWAMTERREGEKNVSRSRAIKSTV